MQNAAFTRNPADIATAKMAIGALAAFAPAAEAAFSIGFPNSTAKFIIGDAAPEATQIATPRAMLRLAAAGAAELFKAPARAQSTTPAIATASPMMMSSPFCDASSAGCSTARGTSAPRAAIIDMIIAKPSATPSASIPRPNSTDPTPQPRPNTAASATEPVPAFAYASAKWGTNSATSSHGSRIMPQIE